MSSPRTRIYISQETLDKLLVYSWDDFLFLVEDCDISYHSLIEKLNNYDLEWQERKMLTSKDVLFFVKTVNVITKPEYYIPDNAKWTYNNDGTWSFPAFAEYQPEEESEDDKINTKVFQRKLCEICNTYDIIFEQEYEEKRPDMIEILNLWYEMKKYLERNFLKRMR